jgi:hypothetical protein
MAIAGNNKVGFARDRAFQNPIIVVIRWNGIDSKVRIDNFRDLRQQLQTARDLFVRPVETNSENAAQFIHKGRRNQEHVMTIQGRAPYEKWAARPPGEGRNINIAVENDPKLSGFGDTHE